MRRNGKSVGKTVRNQSRSPDFAPSNTSEGNKIVGVDIELAQAIKASQKSIGSEKTEKNDFSWNKPPAEQNLKT